MSNTPAHAPAMPHPGLNAAEVAQSRQQHGDNVLTPPARDPWWKQWLSKFEDPVIRILMIAAALQIGVAAYKGEGFIEGLGIVVAILLATTLAFLNEYKANREFDILNKVNDDTPVKVVRDGKFESIPKRDVVVGDIVLIETGEEVPCDGEVLDAVALLVDESKLTGEAVPVTKTTAAKAAAKPAKELAYPQDRVYRSTIIADGHGMLRVTEVGDHTEIGKTARAASEQEEEQTPLNEQLDRLSKIIGIVGLGIAGLTFFALVIRGSLTDELPLTGGQWGFTIVMFTSVLIALSRVWLKILYEGVAAFGWAGDTPEYLDEDTAARWGVSVGTGAAVFGLGLGLGTVMGWLPEGEWLPSAAGAALLNYFMIAVVIIVVAVPEGLAMSVTLSLAYSMRKMTAQNTLVRKMHACETIGAATVICSDKTGTLTMNQMRVAEMRIPALGDSGKPDGEPGTPGALVSDAIAVNSTALLSKEDGVVKALGNPTEGALLVWLDGQGVDYLATRTTFQVADQLPFSTDRKYMATAGTDTSGRIVLHAKGAPERILERCANILTPTGPVPLTAETRTEILAGFKELQGRAMRTIGLAYRDVSDPAADIGAELNGLTWIGYAGIMDPVRPEVPGAIDTCRLAGLDVKMVTGDSPDTAREIARQIGLLGPSEVTGAVLTGTEFGELTDEQVTAGLKTLKVLARARPMDKLRLVRLLQDQREVVAVTGDGTNDAPALNHAKVGLAMGQTGTAVAKEAADIVLLDDSFGSIVNAVRWGRGLYENIQRFILFQLTINVVALCVALLGPFIGVNLPLTVMQMLWVNLIMDTFAALALATEPPHAAVLRRKPRHPDAFIVTPVMRNLVFGIAGVFLVVLLALLFALPGLDEPLPLEGSPKPEQLHSLTLFFCTFVMLQFWNLFNARCLGTNESAFTGLMENKAFLFIAGVILFGQVALVHLAGDVFRTVPLTFVEWLIIFVATSPVLIIGEVVRARARMAEAKAAPSASPQAA